MHRHRPVCDGIGTGKVTARVVTARESTKGNSCMRFLITGGAGFIGSYLAETLFARGHRVHILDEPSTGSIDTIRHLTGAPRFGYTRS